MGPTPVEWAEAEQVTAPPVLMSFPASSWKLIRSAGCAVQVNTPSLYATSSTGLPHNKAARAAICCLTASAAAIAARPVSKAMRLPPGTPGPSACYRHIVAIDQQMCDLVGAK